MNAVGIFSDTANSCVPARSPVHDDGYGVSYMVSGEREFFFHVSSKRSSSKTDSVRFVANIREALDEMKAVLELAIPAAGGGGGKDKTSSSAAAAPAPASAAGTPKQKDGKAVPATLVGSPKPVAAASTAEDKDKDDSSSSKKAPKTPVRSAKDGGTGAAGSPSSATPVSAKA